MSFQEWENRLHVTEFAAIEAILFSKENQAAFHPEKSLRNSSGSLAARPPWLDHDAPNHNENIDVKPIAIPALLLACSWSPIQAELADPHYPDPYYVDPAIAPYPPGCVTLPARQVDLYGDNVVQFWSGDLSLELVYRLPGGPNFGRVQARMFRVGCAEPNRSVIMMEFRLPAEWVDPRDSRFVLPTFVAEGPGGFHYIPFELKAEPNAWGQSLEQQSLTKHTLGDYTGGWDNPRLYTWRYVLDMAPAGAYWEPLAEAYNGAFVLQRYSNGNVGGPYIEVPATDGLIDRNPALPLNGRLTGTWVEPGAADQGFLLTFSNPVPPAGSGVAPPRRDELLVFLSWYTFDAEGGQLWLAGNARFPLGATEVTVPVVQVMNGQFLGPPVETGLGVDPRTTIGEVHLKARSCDVLELDYDLAALELGAGTLQLQRLFALETAGYPCRDYAARLAGQSPNPAH
jgi:hypothetical protein